MQLHGSVYKSVPHCAREVFRNEGLSAFYVSYPTTLCMTVPFTALQFMSYESISKVMNPTGRYDPYTHCFAGGLAGGLAAGFTTPLDVIKTLLQTRGNATDAELRNVSGLVNAAKIIHQRDGWKGYFRGLKPRIITTMPSTAICWYAQTMAFIRGAFWANVQTGQHTKWRRLSSSSAVSAIHLHRYIHTSPRRGQHILHLERSGSCCVPQSAGLGALHMLGLLYSR